MLRIAQGRVYDPANGIDGEVRDVCLDGGKVVEEVPSDARRLDARGMVVMPGGVDIHSHIAGPAVNAARKLAPEEHRADVVDRTAVTRSGTDCAGSEDGRSARGASAIGSVAVERGRWALLISAVGTQRPAASSVWSDWH